MNLPEPLAFALESVLACPRCGGDLAPLESEVECTRCRARHPVVNGVLDFLAPPSQEGGEP